MHKRKNRNCNTQTKVELQKTERTSSISVEVALKVKRYDVTSGHLANEVDCNTKMTKADSDRCSCTDEYFNVTIEPKRTQGEPLNVNLNYISRLREPQQQSSITMSTHHNIENGTILGTVSGTVLTVLVNIGSSDIIKTVALAALGAVVSFSISLLLKWLIKKFGK
jgi:hypothetical protein